MVAENKFKVGDRVEIVNVVENKKRHEGVIFTIDSDEGELRGEQSWSGKDNPSPYRFRESELRLVAPATSSPIRTVTRREIVPGVYGPIKVGKDGAIDFDRYVWRNDPDQLREAARIFNEIADVLEEQQEAA